MACFICGRENIIPILDLGLHPPSDAFLRKDDLSKPEAAYPLEFCFCRNCKLAQLNYVVDPEKLFRDYVYNTATNNALKANFKNLVDLVVSKFGLKEGDFALDIGSNDGTLLSYYLPYGIKILGVDPSSATDLALAQNIPTIVDFFSHDLSKKIAVERGHAKIITATNVFAHVADIHDFMSGTKELMAPAGVFVSENGYLLDLIEKLQYDSIYHEHLRYYSIKPLAILFDEFGMEIFDVERISSHGGSIRVFAARKGDYEIQPSVKQLMDLEESAGLYKESTFIDFADKVRQNKFEIQKFITEQKSAGKKIAGIGAPAKGNTLLNYCRLGPDIIDHLAEKSELKIGLFSPGMHIPVVDETRLFSEQPDFALLLSWNLADELIPKIRAKGYKGKFIIPNPEVIIV
ncbi:MAG: class I SAM-dependent methyltransferase [Candidatus Niyogibacteria bacterium]|nr:MAG: class I SAM-dependent methyltransferase [Candidatus Niyogibacteria bacterium]